MKKVFTLLLVLAGIGLYANNLQINNVVLTDNDPVAKTVMIRFDISWDNSWRDEINWDAAWVFAKYFDGELPYRHCKLSLEGAVYGSGTSHELIVPNDSLQLEGVYYGVGAFIYRNALSDGTFEADSVMLKWNYGLNGFETLPADIEVHVYGTEMVYIPEGPFAFGDGDGVSMSGNSWQLKDSPDYVFIGDYLATQMINPMLGNYYIRRVHGMQGLDWDGDGDIDNPNFPTGYKAFYMMKYETTQGQYVDFLNSLTSFQINTGTLFSGSPPYGNTISNQNGKFVCEHPDRVCYFSENYNLRYLSLADWIGLRNLTELEYEKSERGTLTPNVNEYAWGNTTSIFLSSISGQENGTETSIPPDANIGYGPHRVGIFAKENTDRISSGSGYYGIMDLSGNRPESIITLLVDVGFQNTHGDGDINSEGLANSFYKLLEDGSFSVMTNYYYYLGRNLLTSDLSYNNYGTCRFVRNAPILP